MRQPKIAILGAGAGGLCMGVQLQRAGFRDFTIFEKSDRVGGTWHDNTYPGAACDVPSHLYSFSFESKRDWSRKFAPQSEIQAYFQHVAERWGLLARTRFGAEVSGASFDEAAGQWRLRTRAGEEHVADVLVSGLGQLNRPHVPDFPGLASFEGASWHSARWNHDYDVTGKRVGVIGNAASALQFIPHLARKAERLHVFQRTPNYVVPRFDREFTERERWAFEHVPGLQRLYRSWIWARLEFNWLAFTPGSWWSRLFRKGALTYLETMVKDPELRAKLTPDYPIGCKRILISDDYFQAMTRPNVELVTDPIERIEPHAVVTGDGARREHGAQRLALRTIEHGAQRLALRSIELDALVFGTGFDTTHFLAPLEIEGRGGAKLRDAWQDGAEAYLGLTVAGFPNLFLLYGPNTNLGHNSILFMIECQTRYAIRCLQELARRDGAWLDVRRDAMDRYNAEVQEALRSTAWNASCGSWYKTEAGKITNNWKGFTTEYWWRTRRPDFSAFEVRARA